MRSPKFLPLLLVAGHAVAGEGYIVGAGIEGDSADSLAVALVADVGLTEKTWVSGSLARNSVDSALGQAIDTWYGDVGLDHFFDPVGVRLGAAYWGDSDTLRSNDLRASLYWRNDAFSLSGDYEFRDFTIDVPSTDFFPGRRAGLDATGIGLSTRFALSDTVDLSVRGMSYDYSVNLGHDRNRGILELLSFSRLSLINSLVDYRAFATLGVDAGDRRWQFELGTWKGELDGSTTRSATVRFLTPLVRTTDVEFGLGLDDSDLCGSVTFLSVFFYFYGGT